MPSRVIRRSPSAGQWAVLERLRAAPLKDGAGLEAQAENGRLDM
jgi:hypothetical protein